MSAGSSLYGDMVIAGAGDQVSLGYPAASNIVSSEPGADTISPAGPDRLYVSSGNIVQGNGLDTIGNAGDSTSNFSGTTDAKITTITARKLAAAEKKLKAFETRELKKTAQPTDVEFSCSASWPGSMQAPRRAVRRITG